MPYNQRHTGSVHSTHGTHHAHRYLTDVENEEFGIRKLSGMTLHGKQFRLHGLINLENDNEIPQTKGIVELTITPSNRHIDVFSA